jgi:hypothetical protein
LLQGLNLPGMNEGGEVKNQIYVIKDASLLVKIGSTTNVRARLSQYRTHNPTAELVIAIDGADRHTCEYIERTAHNILARFHEKGEWFSCSTDVACFAVKRAREIVSDLVDAQDHAYRLQQKEET